MDLRPYIKTTEQINQGIELIRNNFLLYQPFILDEDIEVGEGQNMHDGYAYSKSVFDLNVYAKDFTFGERKLATNKDHFRKCNEEFRSIYEFISQNIFNINNQNLCRLSFGEIGCNTGLNLFNLAVKGAKSCIGYDWNDMSTVFNWLNGVLKTKVSFSTGIWDSLYHKFTPYNIPEVDIMINTVFTNHLCDPLQFLSYICDRSKKGVFLCVLINHRTQSAVEYDNVGYLFNQGASFPLNFNNGVSLSKGMVETAFKSLGFNDIIELHPKINNPKWDLFTERFAMFYAKRTSNIKSAYWK